ncbi:hypothetical protein L1987_76681 [Smallanthus sonchifolius]|uniref:Uncharacterized protein n=1 Tax=Smallanthus sonchifolius TaxID=185202 RepID=A0ACB8Z8X6_9ASTR|nr:hypothetical protein L1987_76681 [Smallanthus sonchifolius]
MKVTSFTYVVIFEDFKASMVFNLPFFVYGYNFSLLGTLGIVRFHLAIVVTPLIIDFKDLALAYYPNGYPSTAYYYGGYEGTTKFWDDVVDLAHVRTVDLELCLHFISYELGGQNGYPDMRFGYNGVYSRTQNN